MINDNELKKGNWVIFDNTNKRHPQQHHVKVLELKEKEVVVLDPVGLQLSLFYQTNSIRPIPLTPEVLEKCGFKKEDKEYDFWRLYFAEIDTQYPSSILWGLGNKYVQVCRNFTAAASPPTEHLHQLQNLYFALTQTEIEYKP